MVSEIVDNLVGSGIAVVDGFLGEAATAALHGELSGMHSRGELRRAGVGRGGGWRLDDEVRRDEISWLAPGPGDSPARRELWEKLDTMRATLNRELFLGLRSFEGHFAVYPPGAFYTAHRDRFEGTSARILSSVLYLDPAWDREDGGQLRLHTGTPVDVFPAPGRLVLFRSEELLHEVMPTRRERCSFTGWFRRSELGEAFLS
jgi:SM-20-related protein